MLILKLRGHCAHYGYIGNTPALRHSRTEVERVWRKWLSHRLYKAGIPRDRSALLRRHYPLPPALAIRPLT